MSPMEISLNLYNQLFAISRELEYGSVNKSDFLETMQQIRSNYLAELKEKMNYNVLHWSLSIFDRNKSSRHRTKGVDHFTQKNQC